MSDTIQNDKVVHLHYVLTDGEGKELDRSHGDEPLTYLHGHGNIVPGLEEALLGKQVGDALDVVVPPEKAYGPRNGKQQKVPLSALSARAPAGEFRMPPPVPQRRNSLPVLLEALGQTSGMGSPGNGYAVVRCESVKGVRQCM